LQPKQTPLNFYITYFIVAAGLFAFVGLFTMFGVYAERKVSAFIQTALAQLKREIRWLQVLADMLKMVQKELIIPAAADKILFLMAPIIIFIGVYLGFAALPWAPGLIPAHINIGLYYISLLFLSKPLAY
jgi:NADH-quinone oxidoreductase subunit H